MKQVLVSTFLLAYLSAPLLPSTTTARQQPATPTGNLIIITLDGYRWQELFTGADPDLLNNPQHTPDAESLRALYWDSSATRRRQLLMPFCWTTIARQGQLYGNRHYQNEMNVANTYAISYPGYNEILTGTTDPFIASNRKKYNPNTNVLEYLDAKPEFHGKVAAFSSWDVFPYILGSQRNQLPINSGYTNGDTTQSPRQQTVNRIQDEVLTEHTATRDDQLTFIAAREYLRTHQPRVLFLGLGQTDEYAHQGRYDLYLQQANTIDHLLAELWHWIQTTPGYRNNTTLLITTDHGRGQRPGRWSTHGAWTAGSSQTWMAVIGPNIAPLGEIKTKQQFYQQQLASTIASLVGENFEPGVEVPSSIPIPGKQKQEEDVVVNNTTVR